MLGRDHALSRAPAFTAVAPWPRRTTTWPGGYRPPRAGVPVVAQRRRNL